MTKTTRFGIALAFAFASLSTVACTAAPEEGDDGREGQSQTQGEAAEGEGNVQSQQQGLSCQRFPKDSCVTIGTICRKRGGELWCDLMGNCTCRFPVILQPAR